MILSISKGPLRGKFLRLHFEGVIFKRQSYLLALGIDRNYDMAIIGLELKPG